MYVLCGIEIAVMDHATFWARPDTHIERKTFENMSTVEAAFGRGIPLINLDQVPSIPRCFVFQVGHKLRPAHITDRFGKTVVLDQVLDVQALDADRLVFTN